MLNKPLPIWLHLLGCACFLTLPFLMRPGSFSEVKLDDFRTKIDLLIYVLFIGFFYLNYYLLIPSFYFSQRYLLYIVIIFSLFLAISFLPDLLFTPGQMPPPPMVSNDHRPPPRGNFFIDRTSRHFFVFLAICLLSFLLKINQRWRKAEQDKLSTELSYLRAQINPHFLFNTLNSIYYLALEKSDETANAVIRLSAMMRYVLDESSKDFVPLKNELDYIEDYIDLQKLRFGNTLPLQFSVNGEIAGKKIPPLLLMSFIENAFKHGINAEENGEIKIEINISNAQLLLSVYNKKVNRHLKEEPGGIGIANSQKRLEILYPGKHELTVEEGKDYFQVQLKIDMV